MLLGSSSMTNDVSTSAGAAAAPQNAKSEKLKWYVVHTYSGFENRAKKSLEDQIKQKAHAHNIRVSSA
jgi:hypothetical protein